MSSPKDSINKLINEIERRARIVKEAGTFQVKADIAYPNFDLNVDTDAVKDLQRDLEASVGSFCSYMSTDLKVKLDASIEAYGVVDTGALKNSLIIETTQNSVDISYNVPYAALQQYGGYVLPYGNRNAQPVYITPRPWLDAVLDVYDFDAAFDASSKF